MTNDFGHEPWARAAVERGEKLTPEQGAELLASLTRARSERDQLAEMVVDLREQNASLREMERRARGWAGSELAHFEARAAARHILGSAS